MSEHDDGLLADRLRAHLDRVAAHPVPMGLEGRVFGRLTRGRGGRGHRFFGGVAVALATAVALTLILALGVRSHQAGSPSSPPPAGAQALSSPSPSSSAVPTPSPSAAATPSPTPTPSWTPAPVPMGTPAVPAGRNGGSIAFDGNGNRLIMFGTGNDQYTPAPDDHTYAWTTDGWRVLSPPVSPPARYRPAIAWDPVDHVDILVGGIRIGSQLGYTDTWMWDGTTWTQLPMAGGPHELDSPVLTWDDATGQLLLTGVGSDHPTPPGTNPWRAETWVWKSRTWVLADYLTTPQTSQPQVAYDPAAKRVVMIVFGTLAGHDTMESWDGTRWQPMSVAVPNNLWDVVTDYARGGIIGVGSGSGTFFWNGSTWTQVESPNDPNEQADIAFAWDPTVNAVAEYGVMLTKQENGTTVGTNETSTHVFLWTGQDWQSQNDGG